MYSYQQPYYSTIREPQISFSRPEYYPPEYYPSNTLYNRPFYSDFGIRKNDIYYHDYITKNHSHYEPYELQRPYPVPSIEYKYPPFYSNWDERYFNDPYSSRSLRSYYERPLHTLPPYYPTPYQYEPIINRSYIREELPNYREFYNSIPFERRGFNQPLNNSYFGPYGAYLGQSQIKRGDNFPRKFYDDNYMDYEFSKKGKKVQSNYFKTPVKDENKFNDGKKI